MMLPLSSSAELTVTDASDPSDETSFAGFRPDLAAVLRQLVREFPGIPMDDLRSVFVSCVANLDTTTQGSLPELLYRLAGHRLGSTATSDGAGTGGSRPPPVPRQCPAPRSAIRAVS